MFLKEVIANADELRPNSIRDELKSDWVYELESEIAEMMEIKFPVRNPWPQDALLLMPKPYDSIYCYYLCARIAQANEETTLYANDMVIANSAIADAKAWWRRNHIPCPHGEIRGL